MGKSKRNAEEAAKALVLQQTPPKNAKPQAGAREAEGKAVTTALLQNSGNGAVRPTDILSPPAAEHRRRASSRWNRELEERLVEGHQRYGSKWELIRSNMDLQRFSALQLKDK